jgi:tellurite resistance protein
MSAFFVPRVPAAFFGIVLGLGGLGSAWRVAHRVWGLPAAVGDALMLVAAIVWAVLVALYIGKWIYARAEALGELSHPVQCCFVGLIGVTTILIGGAALPYSYPVAATLFVLGAAFTLAFAVWRTGGLWQGGRDPTTTTAVLYLPTVAGSFVTAAGAAGLGFAELAQMAFGAGVLSWLAIESVLLHRLYTVAMLPAPMRPTLGIQLAPATVGAVAYLSITVGTPDIVAHMLLGYGLLQALVLLRLLPWIRQQSFAPSYWAFTFGTTALSIAPLRMVERGDGGAIALLAPVLFVGANLVVGLIAVGTVRLALQRRLLPAPVAA